jgi:hypothetical protein
MRIRTARAALACCCLLVPAGASAESLETVQACLAANAPTKSAALAIQLASEHRGGGTSKHEGAIRWKRGEDGHSRTLICMRNPPPLRGLAYLIHETDDDVNLWGYLPEEERVNRIHASGAARRARIARTAISYDDLRYLPLNMSSVQSGQPRDARIGDRAVWEVDLSLPPGEDSVYDRIVSFIDPDRCVPLRTEFYGPADELLKAVTTDPNSIEQTNGIYVAHRMRIEDRKNEVQTDLRVEKIEIDGEIPDRTFAPNRLGRNACSQ